MAFTKYGNGNWSKLVVEAKNVRPPHIYEMKDGG